MYMQFLDIGLRHSFKFYQYEFCSAAAAYFDVLAGVMSCRFTVYMPRIKRFTCHAFKEHLLKGNRTEEKYSLNPPKILDRNVNHPYLILAGTHHV